MIKKTYKLMFFEHHIDTVTLTSVDRIAHEQAVSETERLYNCKLVETTES